MIMYSCQESAKYYDKERNGEEISHVDAHHFADITIHEAQQMELDEKHGQKDLSEQEEKDIMIANFHHSYTHVTLKPHIEVHPVHVQNVQILWRAGRGTIPKSETA